MRAPTSSDFFPMLLGDVPAGPGRPVTSLDLDAPSGAPSTPDVVALLEREVRARVRTAGIDPLTERVAFQEVLDATLVEHEARAARGRAPALPDAAAARRAIQDAVGGLGPLQPYLDDPEVEEIWINDPERVFVARNGEPELTTTILRPDEVRELVERMLRLSGRRLDLSSPFVDAALPGGERLHVVIPDVTRAHWAVNIRKHVVRASRLTDLVALGSLTAQAASFLHAAVVAGLNILVSGQTQAGK